jgi:hypothetical protein
MHLFSNAIHVQKTHGNSHFHFCPWSIHAGRSKIVETCKPPKRIVSLELKSLQIRVKCRTHVGRKQACHIKMAHKRSKSHRRRLTLPNIMNSRAHRIPQYYMLWSSGSMWLFVIGLMTTVMVSRPIPPFQSE